MICEFYDNIMKLSVNKFSKTLKCSVQYLADKHKMSWTKKFIIPQNLIDIDDLLNCILLKLLQPLQQLIHFFQ